MYLCIYKRNNKLYWANVQKLTEKFSVTNEKLETVNLSYKQKIDSFLVKDYSDLKKHAQRLKKYDYKLYVFENKFHECTQIKIVIFLLNNPYYDLVLEEKKCYNEEVPDGEVSTKVYVIENLEDWEKAQEEFDFKSDFIHNII